MGNCKDFSYDISVDNISELRNIDGNIFLDKKKLVYVKGHTTPGSGCGPFYWESTDSVSPDNNSTIIQANGVPVGRWKRLIPEINYFDLSWFGDLSSSDRTPLLNTAISEIPSGSVLTLPAGSHPFQTRPNDINKQVWILGSGKTVTGISKDFQSQNAWDAVFNFTNANSSRLSNFNVYATGGSQQNGIGTGSIVSINITGSNSSDAIVLEDLWLSSTAPSGQANTEYMIYVDGSIRTSPGGVRDMSMRDCFVFGGEYGSVYLKTVVDFSWQGGICVAAGGKKGVVKVTGISSNKSYAVNIDIDNCIELDIDYANYVVARGLFGKVTNTPNAFGCHVGGIVSGTVQDNWVDSGVSLPRVLIKSGQALSANTGITVPHSLGSRVPSSKIFAELRCISQELGFNVGDTVNIDGTQGITFYSLNNNTTSVGFTVGDNISIISPSSGLLSNITLSKWVIDVYVER